MYASRHRLIGLIGLISAILILASSSVVFAQSGAQVAQVLTLQSATDALFAKNLTVLAARYNVDLFRAQRIAAGLKPSPTLVLSASQIAVPRVVNHPEYLSDTANAAANTTYTADAEKLIERGGKRELRIGQAELQTQMAEAQLTDALRQQTFALQQAFLSALLARENLRVVRQNLDDFGRTEQLLVAQVNQGYSAGVDLRRVRLERVDFQGEVGTAEENYAQNLRDVFNLIGEGEAPSLSAPLELASAQITSLPDQELKLIDGNLDIKPIGMTIEELRNMALANRPDLRAAELDYQSSEEGIKLAGAERSRDITVGTQYARIGADNTVGVALGIPITTKAHADAVVAQATAAKAQSEARMRQARAQVLTDVEKAYVAYNISREKLTLFTDQVLRNATEVRDIEQVAYREGGKGLLDFLDAQHAYNQTLVSYNQARYDFAVAIYQLESAVGTPLTSASTTTAD